jgi:hypothetical protein
VRSGTKPKALRLCQLRRDVQFHTALAEAHSLAAFPQL